MQNNVKYRYALDNDGRVVDVNDFGEQDRMDYECISCGDLLRPAMGEKNRKHFRHKIDVPCSLETYLHNLGKLMFLQAYNDSRQTGTPFEIELFRPVVCNYCHPKKCNLKEELVRFNLIDFFKKIDIEKNDDGFRPDILISSENGEKIYIEIAVTHVSTEEKKSRKIE